jgi:hypothetical protein
MSTSRLKEKLQEIKQSLRSMFSRSQTIARSWLTIIDTVRKNLFEGGFRGRYSVPVSGNLRVGSSLPGHSARCSLRSPNAVCHRGSL